MRREEDNSRGVAKEPESLPMRSKLRIAQTSIGEIQFFGGIVVEQLDCAGNLTMADVKSPEFTETLHVVHTPRVCGGRARIAGTRITVWVLERKRRGGDSVADILRAFPSLNEAQVYAGWAYADEHRAEIDADIQDNEDG